MVSDTLLTSECQNFICCVFAFAARIEIILKDINKFKNEISKQLMSERMHL